MNTTIPPIKTETNEAETRVSVHVKVFPSVWAKAQIAAKREGIPVGKVVENAITEHCEA